jgi:hypothetical protein
VLLSLHSDTNVRFAPEADIHILNWRAPASGSKTKKKPGYENARLLSRSVSDGVFTPETKWVQFGDWCLSIWQPVLQHLREITFMGEDRKNSDTLM